VLGSPANGDPSTFDGSRMQVVCRLLVVGLGSPDRRTIRTCLARNNAQPDPTVATSPGESRRETCHKSSSAGPIGNVCNVDSQSVTCNTAIVAQKVLL
jgi:hypothetical protein